MSKCQLQFAACKYQTLYYLVLVNQQIGIGSNVNIIQVVPSKNREILVEIYRR